MMTTEDPLAPLDPLDGHHGILPRSKWGRRTLVAAVGLIAVLGFTSAAGQYLSLKNDEAQETASQVASCRSELRDIYKDQPRDSVQAVLSRLSQINAAGLEAAVDGEAGTSADGDNPYSGLTLAQLREVSGEARIELAKRQKAADAASAEHTRLVALAARDTAEYLSECERLTP